MSVLFSVFEFFFFFAYIFHERGTHTAMKSGMLAAESAFEELTKDGAPASGPIVLNS